MLCTPPPSAPAEVRFDGPPPFSWKRVVFFALNPLALLPVAALGLLLRVNLAGPQFALTAGAVASGALYAVPLLVLSNLPIERLPGLKSFSEIDAVSKFLTLLLLGSERGPRPLARAVVAGALVSACAGFAEELVFRGFLQSFLAGALGALPLPPALPVPLAIGASSLVFGALHSYSASPAYAAAAFAASAYFGWVFASTGSIFVAMVAHAVVDLYAFLAGHVTIAYLQKADARRAIWDCDQPLAGRLREMVRGPVQGQGAKPGASDSS